MKKQILKSALIAVAGVGLMAGSALAIETECGDCCQTVCENGSPIAFSTVGQDLVDPNVKMSATAKPDYVTTFNYSFDLNALFGITANDSINNAFLEIFLADDSYSDPVEKATFKLDTTTKNWGSDGYWWWGFWVDTTDWSPKYNIEGLVDQDLKLTINITATDGDFILKNLELSGDYCAAPVPEPTTMLLFGTGLMGLAAIGRRRIES